MPYLSPLRYPGGKRRLAKWIVGLIDENGLGDLDYVEPYAGGASLGLFLLFNEYASRIFVNDLSRPVYAFWWAMVHENERFVEQLNQTEVTMAEWREQRQIYQAAEGPDLFALGFAAFFLNRVNRSGIISGRPIGGLEQSGRWKLDARFNREDLLERVRRVGRYRTRISVSCQDAADFIDVAGSLVGEESLFFIDPPYIDSGRDLYLNRYDAEGHRQIERKVVDLRHHWIVTYDSLGATRLGLYADHSRVGFRLPYSAQSRRQGQEVMFLSPSLRAPPDLQAVRHSAAA